MPTPSCWVAKLQDIAGGVGAAVFAFVVAQWGHLAAAWGEYATPILQVLSALVAVTTIYRNIFPGRQA